MRKISTLLILMVLSISVYGLSGEIIYLEGTVDYRPAGEPLDWAEIGTPIAEGDSIITGVDGLCEIQLEGGSRVTIDSDTVFSLSRGSLAKDEEPQTVFHVALGKVAFKFNQLIGREPAITTPVSTCGIRGTEFTVVASADGQSLYVLTQGEVAIESRGVETALTPDQGVEVTALGLGETFPVLQDSLDYSNWREEAQAHALEDPSGTLRNLTALMMEHIEQADYYRDQYEKYKAQKDRVEEEIKTLRAEGKADEAQTLVKDQFLPLKTTVLTLILNYRYYAISVLSLRHYSVGTLYVQQRSLNWGGELPEDFQQAYSDFLKLFEERAVPYYESRDI